MRSPCVAWPLNLETAGLRALLAALLAVGCSDESHLLGGDGARLVDGRRLGDCSNGAEVEVIDRMEDGDGTIDTTKGRGGVWFAFNDKTGEQVPAADAETFEMTALRPPRGESHFAARTHGGGFSDWGAGIGFELYNQQPYDLSGYAGITFWARRGEGSVATVRFAVTDPATAPRGGQCKTYETYSECSDYFGADLILDTSYRRYSFSWAELKQKGWGEPHPPAVRASAIYGVRFQTDPGVDFDFTIDDIGLLCRPR